MPDLSLKASHQFWAEYHDKMIYRVLMMMEGVEHWTLDGNPELEEAIEKLGLEFDELTNVNMDELGHEESFIRLAGHLKASRMLRLLQSIDSVHPGAASKILVFAEETTQEPTDPAGLFLRRNIVFERLRLLGRVFSTERIKLIMRVLEGEDHE